MTTLVDKPRTTQVVVLTVLAAVIGALTVIAAAAGERFFAIGLGLPLLLVMAGLVWMTVRRIPTGWVFPALATTIGVFGLGGLAVFSQALSNRTGNFALTAGAGLFLVALAAGILLFVVVEFGVLRLLGLSRLGAITRVTYYEALLQPFTLIMVAIALGMIVVGAFAPFFTLNEDAKMYRDVATSFCLLFTLPIMIFAASKVVDEEIENRTMLTLMSKPVARWQVIVGKYLGVVLVSFVTMALLGMVVAACAYVRYFDDNRMDYMTQTTKEGIEMLNTANNRAIISLIPALVLQFLQIATLASVAVAISTRWGLALNVTIVSVLYIFANLTQYVDTLNLTDPWQTIVTWASNVLPHLNVFDLNQRLIYGSYRTAADLQRLAAAGNEGLLAREMLMTMPTLGEIWMYVGSAFAYAVFYITAMLSVAVGLFRTRELT